MYFVLAGKRGPRELPETLRSKDAPGPDEAPVEESLEEASAEEPEHAKVAAEASAAEKPA